MKDKVYDLIVIGAGAAGLFLAAVNKMEGSKCLIHNSDRPGKKFLISGGGKGNLTNGEGIKNFIYRYGEKGKKIRTTLYKFNNRALMDFF